MKCVATLALVISLPAHAGAIDLPCPEEIRTAQTITSDHPGWRAASSDLRAKNGISTHQGRPVGFSSGPAQEGALLAPVGDRWPIAAGGDVWLVSAYSNTTIQLSRQIPKGSSVCGIRLEPGGDRYMAWCEVGT